LRLLCPIDQQKSNVKRIEPVSAIAFKKLPLAFPRWKGSNCGKLRIFCLDRKDKKPV
jgi:hypothetical protein